MATTIMGILYIGFRTSDLGFRVWDVGSSI